jgi:DNA-binding transcriptional MerR regulator
MLLKIGELAKRAGLTVRTLHHYDDIGLLSPSARSDAGYRLYNRDDIGRLHQVQALRRFGMSLADIGAFLANPEADLAHLIGQQLAALNRQMAQMRELQGQLSRLHEQLASGQEPELANWLNTLELMTMYDKYFSKEELQQLPLAAALANDPARAEWPALVSKVQALIDDGVPPSDPGAQQLARQWMSMLVRDTNANPTFFARLDAMVMQEPTVQTQTSITPALRTYVAQANTERRLALYANYLTPDELAFMAANMGKHAEQWPQLISEVAKAIERATPPTSPEGQRLAFRWFALFRSYAGENPDTHARIRQAHQQEPELSVGSFVTPAMIQFVQQGAAVARP